MHAIIKKIEKNEAELIEISISVKTAKADLDK